MCAHTPSTNSKNEDTRGRYDKPHYPRIASFLPPALAKILGIHGETQHGIVVGTTFKAGRRKVPRFKDMIDYKFSNPYIAAGIDELSEASVGSGFYNTVNDKYPKVLKFADDWFEEIDLDGMNLDISSDVWACGNSILEQIDPKDLQTIIHLPIGSFDRVYATKFGKITKLQQNIEGTRQIFEKDNLEKLILLSWKKTGTNPLGHGLLESLLNQGVGYTYKTSENKFKTVYRPCFREIMEEIEDAMRKIIIRYVPRFVYIFTGMDTNWVRTAATEIKSVMVGDDLIIALPSGDIKKNDLRIERLETDPRSRLHPYTEYFHNGIITGLETPSIRLFIEAGFTEASARTAVEIRDQKVGAFRRFYKRKIERYIAKPRIFQDMKWHGDLGEREWKRANFRLHWNPLEPPKFTSDQLIALFGAQARSGVWVIPPEEFRLLLTKRGIQLDPTTKPVIMQVLQAQKDGENNKNGKNGKNNKNGDAE